MTKNSATTRQLDNRHLKPHHAVTIKESEHGFSYHYFNQTLGKDYDSDYFATKAACVQASWGCITDDLARAHLSALVGSTLDSCRFPDMFFFVLMEECWKRAPYRSPTLKKLLELAEHELSKADNSHNTYLLEERKPEAEEDHLPKGYEVYPCDRGWTFRYVDYRGKAQRDGFVYKSQATAENRAWDTYEEQQKFAKVYPFLQQAMATNHKISILEVLADICMDDRILRCAVKGIECAIEVVV